MTVMVRDAFAKTMGGSMPWDEVMSKYKRGTLKSGGSGNKVKSRKQAIAIMLSEKRSAQHGKKEYQSHGSPYKVGIGPHVQYTK